jgi:hypothetical protein
LPNGSSKRVSNDMRKWVTMRSSDIGGQREVSIPPARQSLPILDFGLVAVASISLPSSFRRARTGRPFRCSCYTSAKTRERAATGRSRALPTVEPFPTLCYTRPPLTIRLRPARGTPHASGSGFWAMLCSPASENVWEAGSR